MIAAAEAQLGRAFTRDEYDMISIPVRPAALQELVEAILDTEADERRADFDAG
jgi:hypothetical protein